MYDKTPFISVSTSDRDCQCGWEAIRRTLLAVAACAARVVCVECYPGVRIGEVRKHIEAILQPSSIISTEDLLLPAEELNQRMAPLLTDDPVFGVMNTIEIEDYFDSQKLETARRDVEGVRKGITLAIGVGATLVARQYDLLIYADLARWEIQQRQRRGEIGNLGADNIDELPSLKYKRAFFLDWRAADRLKQRLLTKIDFVLDTNSRHAPKMISGKAMRDGLRIAANGPFRVVPFFDPGPWGGHWLEEVCDLPRDVPNYAWGFDCVPEENSLLLGFGDARVEIPSLNLVYAHPRDLLGENIYEHFGEEFPIRFDFLDTVGGGNLSLQVHPLTQYVREKFGLFYTQDESYYMLDAKADACVYLGLKENIDPAAMLRDLKAAQQDGGEFNADLYVNRWPARKHDHFLIPAGTVHCSGRDSMVLEISATPYIFTFKLWDWGRMGLDGRPRPIHLERGAANIQWDRTTEWVRQSLINRIEPLASGNGWREERTGLHAFEFIETRRHWFTGTVPHDTSGTVNVLNLVEGRQAVVESPFHAFPPFLVNYAETFIVPAQVGPYTIRPSRPAEGTQCATIKAFVRPQT
ncbi:MAG: class I mannose-6-phosphate isomerase [Acidobacteriaceae bacterium]